MEKILQKQNVFCVVLNDENILSKINQRNNLAFTSLQRVNKKLSPKFASFLEGKIHAYKTIIQIIMGDDFTISKYLKLLRLLKTLKSGRDILNKYSHFERSKYLNGQISAVENVIKIIKKFNDIDLTPLEN